MSCRFATYFLEPHEVTTLEELRTFLVLRREGKYGAFSLSERRDSWPVLLLYINGELACMFFFRHEGDPGFHSLGEDSDNFEEMQEFVIENYQMDQYCRAMVVSRSEAVAAFEEFFQTRRQPAAVRWFDLG
jgi:hypothetical protein